MPAFRDMALLTFLGGLRRSPHRRIRVDSLSLRLSAHIELENLGDHDHGFRAISILKHCKFQSLCAVNEQTTAYPMMILDDPMTTTIPANAEKTRWLCTLRGRFRFLHDSPPFWYCEICYQLAP
jgi:hypothetical protein